MSVQQVDINGTLVNIAHALPKDQKKLYYIVHPIADRLYKEVDDIPTLSVNELANVFGYVGFETIEKIEKLALSRAFIDGTDTKISEADFDGRMEDYNELIAKAVEVNLASFFTKLADARSERLANKRTKTAQ